ncbi:MAG: LysR family transcriptional regulator [Pseudomonadota bacterium]
MPRNLDLTAIRAFVTAAEAGGVTRAAKRLNLTQSAVSMQLKRLEVSLGQELLDRSGRAIAVTAHGEKLLSYGRRMLALNDEVWSLMNDAQFEGELRIGVPHDIVYPYIPGVLQRFAADCPRVRVELISSFTRRLKEQFEHGEVDIILTTERQLDEGGETLIARRLTWVGAPGGASWRQRPLRLAFETGCIFRPMVQSALDEAGISWDMVVNSDSTRTVDATVSADLAVHANLYGSVTPYLESIEHGGALPELEQVLINMYCATGSDRPMVDMLASYVRQAYSEDLRIAAQ